MKFQPLPLDGAFLIESEPFTDGRGYFARAYCRDEFAAAGIDRSFVQANMSGNLKAGTMRGLHYNKAPSNEAKFLRCVTGSIYDVMVDMRPGSATQYQWYGVELSAANRKAVLVPPMFAHGYLSLSDGAEVLYFASEAYNGATEAGLRYDDPALAIDWPQPVIHVTDKDRSWPDLNIGTA